MWLYVVLNLIYSKSFNVKAKKFRSYRDRKIEINRNVRNIRMGNKRLLNSREKYLEKVKIQRNNIINSDFNTLSMCEWIQDVDGYIIEYYNGDNNILYNFLFMIIQYVMVSNTVYIPNDQEDNFEYIFFNSLQSIGNGDKDHFDNALRRLSKIPTKYIAPYMLKLLFVRVAIREPGCLRPVVLRNENEECKSDIDCDGNLECTNGVCVNHD